MEANLHHLPRAVSAPNLRAIALAPSLTHLFIYLGFSRHGFSVALEFVLELALIDQTGLKFTEIYLPLPP